MTKGGKPIFPVAAYGETYLGLTKREYFAGLAMQGWLANEGTSGKFEDIATDAVKFADSLLAALEDSHHGS